MVSVGIINRVKVVDDEWAEGLGSNLD